MGLLTPAEIKAGKAYSENAGMERSLGEFHQRILLDFMNEHGSVTKKKEQFLIDKKCYKSELIASINIPGNFRQDWRK